MYISSTHRSHEGFEGGYVCIKIAQTFGAKMLEPAQFIYCNHRSL
jgi:hypothetical protein